MVLQVVLNGYFRSGTTILWHLLRLSQPDKLHLHEPFHPKLLWHLNNDIGKDDPMHMIPLWDDYVKLDGHTLKTIIEVAQTLDGSPVTWLEAKPVVEALDRDSHDIYIKCVRAHAILPFLANHYDVQIYHIIRCPACTWIDHFDAMDLRDVDTLLGINPTYNYADRFYLLNTYKKLKQMFDVPFKANNYLDMFVYNWVVSNYLAVTKTAEFDNFEVILYEECVDNDVLRKLGIGNAYYHMFKPYMPCMHYPIIHRIIAEIIYNTPLRQLYEEIDAHTPLDTYYHILDPIHYADTK